jgi:hypothetical protein
MSRLDKDNSLYIWLSSCGLESYYAALKQGGVNEDNFTDLPLEEYELYGINQPDHRQKLFKLIQLVRRENSITNQATEQRKAVLEKQNQIIQQEKLKQRQSQPQPQQQRAVIKPVLSNPGSNSSNGSINPPQSLFQSPRKVAVMPSARRALELRQQQSGVSNSNISNINPAPAPVVSSGNKRQSLQPNSARQSYQPASQDEPDIPSNPIPKRQSFHQPNSARPSYQPPAAIIQPQPSNDNSEDESDYVEEDESIVEEDADAPVIVTSGKTSKIKVAVRKRPLNAKEKSLTQSDVCAANNSNRRVLIQEPKVKVDLTKYTESHQFVFDEVFNENSTNEQIYAVTCAPLINFCLKKGKCTCFAYGQTGSGLVKTLKSL